MHDYLDILGIKVGPAIASATGAICSLIFSRGLSPIKAILSVFGGFVTSVYMAPTVAQYFNIIGPGENGIAFLLGTVGMNVVIGLVHLTEKFRENPIGMLKMFKGK